MGTIGSKPRRHGVLNNERGFALFGVFLTILMMTALDCRDDDDRAGESNG